MSELAGMLEPCGCSGDARGGIDRLVTAIQRARAEAQRAGVPSVVIVAGDTLYGRATDIRQQQDVWGAELIAEVLGRVRPDVIAPGPIDLSHPMELTALAQRTPALWLGDTPWKSIGMGVVSRERDVALGFVLGGAAHPLAAAQREIAALRARAAIVVAIAPSPAIAGADVVVQLGAESSAPADPSTLLLAPGHHGESVLIADLWLGSGDWHPVSDAERGRAFRLERMLVDSQMAPDPNTRRELDQLFARRNSYNQKHPDPPPPGMLRAESYVGSDTCAACHTRAYFWWRTTAHAHAFETLMKRGRQFDRDCISCHVTGYDRSGGATLADVEHFAGVGCESCHGPGSDHADNPRAASSSVRRAVPADVCIGCHDPEHHATFRYDRARPELLTRDHGRG